MDVAVVSLITFLILVFTLLAMSLERNAVRPPKEPQESVEEVQEETSQEATPIFTSLSSGIKNFLTATEQTEEPSQIESMIEPEEPVTGLTALVDEHHSVVCDDAGFLSFAHMFALNPETLDDKANIIKKFHVAKPEDAHSVISFLREEEGLAFIDLSKLFEMDMISNDDQALKVMKLLKRTADIHQGDIACLDPGSNLWLVSSGPIAIEKHFFKD